MPDPLSIAASIVAIAEASSHLPPAKKLLLKLHRKNFEAAYHSAYTNFFKSYGPRSNDLVIGHNFIDKRMRVKEELARLALGDSPNLTVLLDEFKAAYPQGNEKLFLENIKRFREEFNRALESDTSSDTKQIMLNQNMVTEESTLRILRETAEIKRSISEISSSSTVNSLLVNQIEKFGELFSQETEQQLIQLRETLREGRTTETLKQLQSLRKDTDRWGVLSPEVKAKCLCFEGNIELHLTNDVNRAKEYADQARELTSTSNEARLRASIAFVQNNLEEAIEYLTDFNDSDSLHLKAALYLELQNPIQCLQILAIEPIDSNPTAETYRLRALAYLITKKPSQAQLEIQKALELKPNWESVKFSAALIDYCGTLSLNAFIEPFRISADPVEWVFVKRDDESLAKLRQAAAQFRNLIKMPDQTHSEIKRLHAWLLASLANDPERQEEAANYCRSLLDTDPTFTSAIAWALVRNYEIDLQTSETALEKLITNNTASIYHLIALINYYIANQKLDKAIKLLECKEALFQEYKASTAWLLAFSQIQILRDSGEVALEKLDSYGELSEIHNIRIIILHALARKTKDWQPFNDFVEQIKDINSNPNLLSIVCEIKMEQQDWLYIVENTETLLHYFNTSEVLRLVSIAAYNAQNFRLCLELLDNNRHLFPQSKLPYQLKRMAISCQRELGFLSKAILEAEDLVTETPTLENELLLANLYFSKGDFTGLVLAARQLKKRSNLPPEVALQMSKLLLWKDKQLSLMMWNKATETELPDELVGDAFYLGNQLGLRIELKQLSLKLQELGREGRGGIYFGPARELPDMMKQWQEHRTKLDEAFRFGKVPIHFVAQETNASLAVLYHSRLVAYEKKPNPIRQFPLLARHGGRMTVEGFPTPAFKLNLHLDITSVLLAEHLDILSKIEQTFAPLNIPADLIPALIQLREKSTHHQPARLRENQQIVDIVKNGAITIIDEALSPELDNPTLVAEMGKEWVILSELARKNNGYLVDYLPLKKNDLSGDTPSVLPDGIETFLVNCRAIVESLLQYGPLSKKEYYKAMDSLGYEGQVKPSEVIPLQGSRLYCDGAIPETLAEANLLTTVCERFQVYISRHTYAMIQAELDSQPHMFSLADWLDNLISRLNSGLDKQLYQVISVSPQKRQQINDNRSPHPLDGIIAALLGFEIKEGDVIWADDRWINSHRHRDGVLIADIYDVLKLLVGMGQIEKEDYYKTLHRLRAGNVILIPVQRDEIVYQLKQAHVQNNYQIVETQQLKTLRQYVASCLLSNDILQLPPMPVGSPNEYGEKAFIITLMRAMVWALFDIYTDDDIDEQNRPILCEWILNNLYLDNLALSRSTSLYSEDVDEEFQAILGLVLLLSAPFGTGYSDLKNISHRNYFSWLYDRILTTKFIVDPQLLPNTVESLKQTFREVKEEAVQQGTQASLATDLLLKSFYDDLPKPIQEELNRDDDFMANFGLTFTQVITVEDLRFDPKEFFETSYEAINRGKGIISLLDKETQITFEPTKDKLAIRFTHPDTGKEVVIGDEQLVLLMDSPLKLEKMLYQRKYWFDCFEVDLQQAIESIAGTKNILHRIQMADQWRDESPSIYYGDLYQRIRAGKSINLSNLIPPNADRLLPYYRFLLSNDARQDFSITLAAASETLLKEESLEATIHRLVGFPTPLPMPILNAVSSLSEAEIADLVKALLRQAGSPLSKIHLLRILSHLGDKKISYYRLARRIAKRFFTKSAITEFIAFSILLRWVHQEFGYWRDTNKWQPHIQLAMVWAHTHQLFSLMTAAGVPLDWIIKTFKPATKRVMFEMFDRKSTQWFDVGHPRQLNYLAFILTGVVYGIEQKSFLILDEDLKNLLYGTLFQEANEIVLPHPLLLRDITCASNSLGAFLGGSYEDKLASLFDDSKEGNAENKAYTELVSRTLDDLIENPETLDTWPILSIIFSDLPPYNTLDEKLAQLLIQTEFINLIDNDYEVGLSVLEFATMQAIHLNNEDLNQHLSNQFLEVTEWLALQNQEDLVTQNSYSDSIHIQMIDTALNIAICKPTIDERMLLFRDLLSKLVAIWPSLVPTLRPIIQALCENLPVKQGQYFGSLLIRLRAE
ncbi:MAG: hypothetical protein KDJ97_23545 [Anaerolineae bacterium]|nr:hypothetical protein [Anaerolineae bacterium]